MQRHLSQRRKILKLSGYSFGGLLALLAAYFAILAYPGVLFAHSIEYQNFTVHSDNDLAGIEPILQRVERALQTSEIHVPGLKHDIFFGDGNTPFTMIQHFHTGLMSRAIRGRWGPATSSYNQSLPPYVSNIVTFYRPVIESDSLVYSERGVNQSLSRTLAHEAVHTLLMNELGLQRIARTPMWKQEGYADYVAASATILSDPSYDIRESVERILREDLSWLQNDRFGQIGGGCFQYGVLTDEEGRAWNTCYYVFRVLVEYLFDRKEVSFSELMAPGISASETFRELLASYEDGTLQ